MVERVTVYFTNEVLTKGITMAEVAPEHLPPPDYSVSLNPHVRLIPLWHFTWEEAVAKAKEIQQREVVRVRKQLAKLESLTW